MDRVATSRTRHSSRTVNQQSQSRPGPWPQAVWHRLSAGKGSKGSKGNGDTTGSAGSWPSRRRRTTGRPMWPYQVAEALFCSNLLRDGRAWLAKTLARLRGCAARTRFHERRRLAQ